MPTDSLLLSIAVCGIFLLFAGVLAWVDHRTTSWQRSVASGNGPPGSGSPGQGLPGGGSPGWGSPGSGPPGPGLPGSGLPGWGSLGWALS